MTSLNDFFGFEEEELPSEPAQPEAPATVIVVSPACKDGLDGTPFTCSSCGIDSTTITLSPGLFKRPDLCGKCWIKLRA